MAKKNDDLLNKIALGSALGAAGALGVLWLGRKLIKKGTNYFLKTLMTDPYVENLWEFLSVARKYGLQTIVETNLRTEAGSIIHRPLGSPKKFPNLQGVMFNFAQLNTFPTDEGIIPDTSVIIGPCAQKPLEIKIPVLITAMAYGLSLSEKAKIALAKGSSLAGTATNTGEGPFLESERKAADKLILQYGRGKWSKEPEVLKKADMIEIYFGQGASGGVGHYIDDKEIDWLVRKRMGLKRGEKGVVHAAFPNISNDYKSLKDLVLELRTITGGVPIGAKIAAGKYLEKDLEILIEAGVDFVTVAGAEAGTKNTPPILEDEFGLPLFWALCRTAAFFEKNKLKGKVSLLISGGLTTPGDFLKAIALGADAVYIGSIALFAMAHTQVLKPMPWEPPPEVVFFKGKYQHKLNVEEGAKNLAKFLKSCQEEMQEGIRALGKTSIKELSKKDLFALDPLTAETAGIPLGNKENQCG
ncbi:MAG: FMN-binding glutamate synthase family protein [Clostridia bacterium]|nr:FMN-binding glutamate synthase family protein [Clostridia bacterium]